MLSAAPRRCRQRAAGARIRSPRRGARRHRQPGQPHSRIEGRRHPPQPRSAGAGGGAAVPGQHAGGAVRVDGRGQAVRARLGADQARRQGGHQLPVHAAGGAGAASRRRAARVPGQPEAPARTRSSPSSPAAVRTIATTSAARRSSSTRAPIPSTSSCASRIPPASCSPSSTSKSGSKRNAAFSTGLIALRLVRRMRRRASVCLGQAALRQPKRPSRT